MEGNPTQLIDRDIQLYPDGDYWVACRISDGQFLAKERTLEQAMDTARARYFVM